MESSEGVRYLAMGGRLVVGWRPSWQREREKKKERKWLKLEDDFYAAESEM